MGGTAARAELTASEAGRCCDEQAFRALGCLRVYKGAIWGRQIGNLGFKQNYGLGPSGEHIRHYYVAESVGIAAGVFLTAVHHAGLVALTHTPSPMGFLKEILRRPENETACLLMPVGYPAPGAEVPDLPRKPIDDVLVMRES